MHANKFLIGWLRGVYFSSIVNEVIKTISKLFFIYLFIFLRKDFESEKSTKTQNKQFSPSRSFSARKIVAFVVFCSVLLVCLGLIFNFMLLKFKFKKKQVWNYLDDLIYYTTQGKLGETSILVFLSSAVLLTEPGLRFLLISFTWEIKDFYQSFLWNEVDFKNNLSPMNPFPNILAKN